MTSRSTVLTRMFKNYCSVRFKGLFREVGLYDVTSFDPYFGTLHFQKEHFLREAMDAGDLLEAPVWFSPQQLDHCAVLY